MLKLTARSHVVYISTLQKALPARGPSSVWCERPHDALFGRFTAVRPYVHVIIMKYMCAR